MKWIDQVFLVGVAICLSFIQAGLVVNYFDAIISGKEPTRLEKIAAALFQSVNYRGRL